MSTRILAILFILASLCRSQLTNANQTCANAYKKLPPALSSTLQRLKLNVHPFFVMNAVKTKPLPKGSAISSFGGSSVELGVLRIHNAEEWTSWLGFLEQSKAPDEVIHYFKIQNTNHFPQEFPLQKILPDAIECRLGAVGAKGPSCHDAALLFNDPTFPYDQLILDAGSPQRNNAAKITTNALKQYRALKEGESLQYGDLIQIGYPIIQHSLVYLGGNIVLQKGSQLGIDPIVLMTLQDALLPYRAYGFRIIRLVNKD